MVQVNALKRTNSNSSPSSSSGDDVESLTSKSIKMGFRLAGLALQTAMTGATMAINVGDVISDLISAPHQSSEEEEEAQLNNPEVIPVHSSPPQTINLSSSSNVEKVPIEISSSSSSRQTQTTIPQPTSPQSTPASSAKTTPRKNLNSYIMKEVILKKSSNNEKKYDAYVEGKKVSFGDKGYSDFTQHKDVERKQRYIYIYTYIDTRKMKIGTI